MVAAVFAALNEAAVSNDASLAAVADHGVSLVQGMNDIKKITTTLGNAFALGQATTAQGNNSTTLALLNHLAESNNAAVADAANAILIQGKKRQAEMVAAVFAALNKAAASNDAYLAAAANDGLRLVQGMNDINKITTTLGNAVALGQANSAPQATTLALLNYLAASNNAAVADAAKAILIQGKKSQAEMVEAVFAALNMAAASNNASLATAANYGLSLVQGMNDIKKITNTLGNAIALGQATTAQGNNSTPQAATLALLNHLAESNNAAVADAAKAILVQGKRSQAEMVAAVFAALNKASASNDTYLATAANYGFSLVQGMNDINEITTTLGNAVALGQATTAQGNNSTPQAATLALLNHLAESSNTAVAIAAKAILIQGRKSQAEIDPGK